MVRGLVSVVVGFVSAVAGFGCYWDSDTISAEMKGLPDILDAVAGRIDRNPDLYYEMRLKRVTSEMKEKGELPHLLDDAAVAEDRLGRHDAALHWMIRKEKWLQESVVAEDVKKEETYKMLANRGTMKIHKWFSAGKPPGNELLIDGLKDFEAALEINPRAHFGREDVQIVFVKLLLNPDDLSLLSERLKDKKGRTSFREGVLGLVALGNAWESPDAFALLAASLEPDQGQAFAMIQSKIGELERRGSPRIIQTRLEETGTAKANVERTDKSTQAFQALILNGQEYRRNREEYMLAELNQGHHPDTFVGFWNDYDAVPRVDLEPYDEMSYAERAEKNLRLLLGGIALFVSTVVGGLVWLIVRRRRLRAWAKG